MRSPITRMTLRRRCCITWHGERRWPDLPPYAPCGNVIRPLLCVGRKEIRQELESRKCSWCEDSTNAEDAYTRNGIRHHVLPYLTEEVNPRAAAHMAQTSLDLLETEEYLEQQTDQLMERYASAEKMRLCCVMR